MLLLSPRLTDFNLDHYLIMLSIKQGGIKYHSLSLWYDSTWDWTQVSRTIGEHSNHYAIYIYIIYIYRDIGPAVRVFANGPGDLGSIPGRVIPKTLKMELDTTLLNTQHYKVRFKGKVEQSREWSSALPYTLV